MPRKLVLLALALVFLSFLAKAQGAEYSKSFTTTLIVDTGGGTSAGLDLPWAGKSFYARSQHWLFYTSTGSCEGSSSNCLKYACSGDQGLTWSKTALNLRTASSLFSATSNGTHAFYVRYNATGTTTFNQKTMFRVGSLGSSCAITWQDEQVMRAAGGAGTATHNPVLVVAAPSDQAFIAYVNVTVSGSTKKPFVIRSTGTDYSSWTEDTQLSTTHRNWRLDAVTMDADKVLVSYWDLNANENLLTRLYSSGWAAEVDATGSKVDEEAYLLHDGDTVYAFYHDQSTEKVEFISRSTAGTWASRETVTTIDAAKGLWTVLYERLERKFYVYYYNYTNNFISELVGTPGGWPSGKVSRFTTSGANNTMAITSHEESTLVGGESFFGLFWVDNKDGGSVEVEAVVARVSPVPTGGEGAQGFVLPFEVITKPLAEAVIQATNFVLQWPVTFAILGGLITVTVLSHVRKKRLFRDLGFLGLGVVTGNWLIANQPMLFGRYDISFLGPYSIREPPLTLTLFGFDSTALAFSLVMSFIAGMALLGAVALAVKD